MMDGKWRLLEFAADEVDVPEHRMDLIFHAARVGFEGAILSRPTGEEIPLAAVHFDGAILRLQMVAPDGTPQAQMPWLVMTLTNGRFEGCYQNSAEHRSGRS